MSHNDVFYSQAGTADEQRMNLWPDQYTASLMDVTDKECTTSDADQRPTGPIQWPKWSPGSDRSMGQRSACKSVLFACGVTVGRHSCRLSTTFARFSVF